MLAAVEDVARRLLAEEEVAAVVTTCRKVISFSSHSYRSVCARENKHKCIVSVTLSVRGRAISGEVSTTPAGGVGQARKAAAAQRSEVRGGWKGKESLVRLFISSIVGIFLPECNKCNWAACV